MLDEAQVVADAPAADAQVTASESQPGRPPVLKPIMNESWFGKPVEEVDPFVVDDVKLVGQVACNFKNKSTILRVLSLMRFFIWVNFRHFASSRKSIIATISTGSRVPNHCLSWAL